MSRPGDQLHGHARRQERAALVSAVQEMIFRLPRDVRDSLLDVCWLGEVDPVHVIARGMVLALEELERGERIRAYLDDGLELRP